MKENILSVAAKVVIIILVALIINYVAVPANSKQDVFVTESTTTEKNLEKMTKDSIEESTSEYTTSFEDVDILSQVESMIQAELEKEQEDQRYAEQMKQEFYTKKNQLPDNKYEWYLGYKALLMEYSEWIGMPVTIYDVYTADEIYLMQRCVETECFQRSFTAKANVASVIFNRIAHDEFPNNVWDVITTPRQFDYVRTEITPDTVLALEYAFMFNQLHPDVLFFHSEKLGKQESFNGALYYCSDDAVHHFYIVQ